MDISLHDIADIEGTVPSVIQVTEFEQLGHLMIEHDGAITWDEMQAVKNAIWGDEVRAIEVYPRKSQLVNSGNIRHLHRLGENDWAPDMMGLDDDDSLHRRHVEAWAEARRMFAITPTSG